MIACVFWVLKHGIMMARCLDGGLRVAGMFLVVSVWPSHCHIANDDMMTTSFRRICYRL